VRPSWAIVVGGRNASAVRRSLHTVALTTLPAVSRRRRILAVAGLVLVAAAVAGGFAWRSASSSDPVPPSAAVAAYRAAPGEQPPAGDVPQPGVWSYAVTGWECGGVGPVCLRRDLPATAQLTIRRDGGGIQERLFLSEQHGEGRSLVAGDDGWHLTEQWSDLTFLGLGRETTDAATPPPLVVPADLAPGRTWSSTYALREVPVEATSRVLREEPVDVGGTAVPAVVVQTDTRMGGALEGTIRETTWYAPSLGLDARRQVSRRIDGSFRYELELDARLVAPIPEG